MDLDSSTRVQIVVGTYEEFVLGYSIDLDDRSKPTLVRQFANRSHTASVRCVSICEKYLASGGADENILICDLERMKETGSVMNHNGTVNCVAFSPDSCHIISGGDDGTISVIRCGSWVMEKAWKCAHKIRDKHPAAVTGLALHPSGKMLLSIGRDKMIRTWNMVTGRPVHFINVASRCNREELGAIVWSQSGNRYAVCVGSLVDIYDVFTAGIACSITVSGKATSICFFEDDLFCIGEDSGNLTVHELRENSGLQTLEDVELISLEAHRSRVKCISLVEKVPATEERAICFLTAGSDGVIALWKLLEDSVEMVHEVKTGCRITCVDVDNREHNQQKKKKKKKVRVDNGTLVPNISNYKTKKGAVQNGTLISNSSNLKVAKCTKKAGTWMVSDMKRKPTSEVERLSGTVKRTKGKTWNVIPK